MLNLERANRYGRQDGLKYRLADMTGEKFLEREFQDRLTGPQRRRITHKEEARKTHEHEKGSRCVLCRPAKQERPPGWRRPDKELKIAGSGR